MKLNKNFYNQPTIKTARQLLGKFLIRKIGKKIIVGMIIETEAYVGLSDKASHASRGKTKRNEIMFGPPGFWYVYLIYGMYNCLNVVTEHKNYPAAVLIRGVKPILGIDLKTKTDGPGKLCKAFKIDKSINSSPAFGKSCQLWIEERGVKIKPTDIKKAPRVNVDYAGEYKDKLWRFYISL